jgi:hypothetical protein
MVHVCLRLRTFSQNHKILKKDIVTQNMSTGTLNSVVHPTLPDV